MRWWTCQRHLSQILYARPTVNGGGVYICGVPKAVAKPAGLAAAALQLSGFTAGLCALLTLLRNMSPCKSTACVALAAVITLIAGVSDAFVVPSASALGASRSNSRAPGSSSSSSLSMGADGGTTRGKDLVVVGFAGACRDFWCCLKWFSRTCIWACAVDGPKGGHATHVLSQKQFVNPPLSGDESANRLYALWYCCICLPPHVVNTRSRRHAAAA